MTLLTLLSLAVLAAYAVVHIVRRRRYERAWERNLDSAVEHRAEPEKLKAKGAHA